MPPFVELIRNLDGSLRAKYEAFEPSQAVCQVARSTYTSARARPSFLRTPGPYPEIMDPAVQLPIYRAIEAHSEDFMELVRMEVARIYFDEEDEGLLIPPASILGMVWWSDWAQLETASKKVCSSFVR